MVQQNENTNGLTLKYKSYLPVSLSLSGWTGLCFNNNKYIFDNYMRMTLYGFPHNYCKVIINAM